MPFYTSSLKFLLVVIGLIVSLAPVSARAVGDGNNLLPDIPLGPHTIKLEQVVSVNPSAVFDITNAGDGSGRLFLVSPNGIIRIFKDGALRPSPFLNIPAAPSGFAMSGMAFHPDYATNGKLYVISGEAVPNGATPDYSPPQDDTSSAFDNVLFEFQVDATNPDQFDQDSQRELLRVHQPNGGHNMNDLAFGGDGYLYVSFGDGGATPFGTPTPHHTTGQQTTNPYGSILRIDVDTIGPNGRYTIPFDNPFADGAGGNVPEIFAWGVRNPWRISSDRLTGDMYTGTNGDFTIESILRLELGKNYGWNLKEGSFLWDPVSGNATVDPSPNPAFTPPLAEYDHNGTTKAFGSVIGGFVYRGSALPPLFGKYIFFDFVAAELVAMDINTGELELIAIEPTGAQLIPQRDITWGEDEDRELYIGRQTGEVLKLVPTGSDVSGPTILDVMAAGNPTLVSVTFSEPLERGSAETASNFSIDPGISILQAALQSDGVTVLLATTPLAEGVSYTLTVNNVLDLALNPIHPVSQQTFQRMTFDIDINSETNVWDGSMICRYLDPAITDPADVAAGVVDSTGGRTDPQLIMTYLLGVEPLGMLDADGNGTADTFDCKIITAFLFGITSDSVLANGLGVGATRTTASAIVAFLSGFLPGAESTGSRLTTAGTSEAVSTSVDLASPDSALTDSLELTITSEPEIQDPPTQRGKKKGHAKRQKRERKRSLR